MDLLRRYKFAIVIFAVYIFLAAIFTFPLILKLDSHIYDYKGDLLEALWYAWWIKYAWQHEINPHNVEIIAVPHHVDLSQDITKNIGLSFANYPLLLLTLVKNEIFAYNFIMLSTFPLAGIAMYFLAVYLTKNKWASFMAGAAYAFCPYHFAHASHITLANIQWMPLFILFLIKMHDERTFFSAFWCGLFLALTLLSDTYYGYFMLVASATFFFYMLIRKILRWIKHRDLEYFSPKTSVLKNIGLISTSLASAAFFCYPYLYPIIKSFLFAPGAQFSLQRWVRDIKDLHTYSARPLNYTLPAVKHPIFGSFTENFKDAIFYGEGFQEHTLYLSWTVMILAVYAYRKWRNSKNILAHSVLDKQRTSFYLKYFATLSIVALIFSLPPEFIIFGVKIYLPSYYVFNIVPFFRAISRFGIVIMLSLSVMAAYGLDFLTRRFRKKYLKIGVSLGICGLILFEFLNFPPYHAVDIQKTEPVYEWLKEQPGELIIVEYPIEEDDTIEYLFNQRTHRKKLVNGALKGTEGYALTEKIVDIADENTVEVLSNIGVDYVILHLERYNQPSEREKLIDELPDFKDEYGLIKVEEFNSTKVYKIQN